VVHTFIMPGPVKCYKFRMAIDQSLFAIKAWFEHEQGLSITKSASSAFSQM
jgi:hypothetical protein